MSELLIEIGTEELPAIPLLQELANIKKKWSFVLEEYGLKSNFHFYYTPRRLVFFHNDFPLKQKDRMVEFIGAPKDIAFHKGALTSAGKAFLQKAQISENEITFKELKGKEVLYYNKVVKGKESVVLLPQMIEKFLQSLNFGKSMRWGVHTFEFIRAIRSMVCVLNDILVEFEMYGVQSAKKTFIHRSISYECKTFGNAKEYFDILKQNYILLDQEERKKKIENEIRDLEKKHCFTVLKDESLLAELVAITEYPTALLGTFESEFLKLPSEVIITSMRENQRYFAVTNNENLLNHFIVISNAVCEDYSKIIHGNERVLRARLSDGMFFYQNDLHNGLSPEKLSNITYLEGLGTMSDKIQRELYFAKILCENYEFADFEIVSKVLEYAKADLTTQMVYEFTDLQGIMGSYYAKALGFSDELCLAIREQYLPNSEHSALPSTLLSSLVALSIKLETLMGLFSIGKIPSGTKDPYALRRAANGVLKIVLSLGKSFDLHKVLLQAKTLYKDFELEVLENFIFERLHTFYKLNSSFIASVLHSKNTDILFIDESIKTLALFSQKDDFNEKCSTFKRLANIVQKSSQTLDEKLFVEEAEKKLYTAFLQSLQAHNVAQRLENLFGLKPYIDDFFNSVMINVDDERLKNNREALVLTIYEEFLKIADIKELRL
ncbi:glycine--tRNA ligase subunit beta [Campylobacter sp. MIT 21-1685]|uniref:glycine--tRNA ligase subunit beta n=1 Tax=unclassified Campylobacter TaxID=2593542 RepID=UPI00224A5D2C|nr:MULTISPECIES: glycine--tRNA ligase subunit beta [unclassified Campylobacter]MCX2682484.1 glycine--tRNA ligase subunit beta [Campylobacter sp. MIT 21-1684]MCX2750803.1 glycine--tRNA ligase subunit beta [Campylobacter sp. MIT 21-1682]MCX2806965.1 glycine--tRNA ligase subunit beta [Campylobacter sp. MIT 21-1685]